MQNSSGYWNSLKKIRPLLKKYQSKRRGFFLLQLCFNQGANFPAGPWMFQSSPAGAMGNADCPGALWMQPAVQEEGGTRVYGREGGGESPLKEE